ncbi:DEAD/DEAH box helicase family protein [bacterium]|nr:DEAD/DEAH box helicase family protein [bacterium]
MQNSAIKDNQKRGNVGGFLCEKIKPNSKLAIVSAYFTIYAFDRLQEKLSKIDKLDFLFGEPRFLKSLDPEKTDKKSFKIEDEGLSLSSRLQQKKIAKDCADWIKEKVNIKSMIKPNFLHGKMYHITEPNGVESAILGSSNFTVNGLGLGNSPNIELNLELDSNRDRKDLLEWFGEIWNNKKLTEDVKNEVLAYLEQLYVNHSPEFIYYKTLFHVFDRFLEENTEAGFSLQKQLTDTKIWNTLYGFQKEGAKGVINKIKKFNGCILADSVGLGKTFVALASVKYFELRNDKVLVLCPKKLRENWIVYTENDSLNPFREDRFAFTTLSHTDLSRDSGKSGNTNLGSLNWGNFDLVVIDESHNFRNNNKGKTERKSRYEKLMLDIIKSGVKTKVLLLSATPVNNTLKDLRNQLYFITEGNDSAFNESLKIESLKNTLAQAERNFNDWVKERKTNQTREQNIHKLLEKLNPNFLSLLDQLTIARSRKHIKTYYNLAEIGEFPKRLKPISIFPELDLEKRFFNYKKLNKEILGYKLHLFNPTSFVKNEFKSSYNLKIRNLTQEDRENYLIGMMRVNFLKRLESSIESFQITMEKTIQKIDDLIKKINEFQKLRNENAEIEVETVSDFETDETDDLLDSFEVGKKLKFKLAHLDLEKWIAGLCEDKQQLNSLFVSAKDVSPERDGKLQELKKLLQKKILNPTTNSEGKPNKKVIVFTAFSDTANYLYENLETSLREELKVHAALVLGSGKNKATFGKTEFNQILTNFSPISKNRDKISPAETQEIDVLIATDCISEGQNLQDCDYLINYDIHWNPVRIIQRFGRIDRLGSKNKNIQLVNFWPTQDLDNYINLRPKVESKMALVDVTTTTDDNLLKEVRELEELDQEIKTMTYRDKQLLSLKDEVLDLEETDENPALTDFSLEEFRRELLNFLDRKKEELKNAPFGVYSVVPANTEKNISKGVIFCFKQKSLSTETQNLNPIQPYFLVYILNDGTIRFNFVNPKQVLSIFRELCFGKEKPYEELCNLFDSETKNGKEMAFYSELLKKAISGLLESYGEKAVLNLFSGETLPKEEEQVKAEEDFELLTWLVIQ